jgi:hypothetical protein
VPAPSAAGYMRSGVGSPSGTGYVQSTTGAGTSLAFTSNVTSGNLLVVACGGESTVDPLTISDTRSTTWTKATAITTGSNHLAVYYGAATSSGADTVTCGQANSLPRVGLMEISGVNATVDATATVYYNSTSPATLNITTSTAGSFIFAAVEAFHSASTFSAATGVTLTAQSGGADANAVAYMFTGASGTYSTGINITSGAADAPYILVAFTPSSGSTVGSDGDFYIDTGTKTFWGPRASGVYPRVGALQ